MSSIIQKANPNNPVILLTFDVEDWFQVENLKQYTPFPSWPTQELRVEKNIHRILDLLDSIDCNNSARLYNIKGEPPSSLHSYRHTPDRSLRATFFILGWIAERLPHLIREIQKRGHEVASHGYSHKLCREQSIDELREDLMKTKKLLEDVTGAPVYGYRAPSFSINDEILSLIEQTGHLYDSSFNSFMLNKRYGKIGLNGYGRNGILHQISEYFYELQISNFKIGKGVIPWGGGGYFRLIPSRIFYRGVLSILNRQGAYLFYIHPWEIDPDQPKISNLPIFLKIRHYVNLDKTYIKLFSFLNTFKNYQFLTCSDYIVKETQPTRQAQTTR